VSGLRRCAVAVLLIVVPATAVACGSKSSSKPAGETKVGIRKATGGSVLVNAANYTLYTFSRGADCYGDCAAAWPPLRTGGDVAAKKGSGVDEDLLGTTKRKNGKLQVTYDDHPLFLFTGDNSPGQTNGDGTHAFGGVWKAVRATNPLAPQTTTGVSCEPNCGY
jgi:predicted lipoprotein with Yx(FWY)xxD motif